jgi:hypothetical protein
LFAEASEDQKQLSEIFQDLSSAFAIAACRPPYGCEITAASDIPTSTLITDISLPFQRRNFEETDEFEDACHF